jgi:electron transport complex protein RnfB
MSGILTAALLIGGVGLFIGAFLGFASKAFAVPVDEKEAAIEEVLPGANCGGCGYSGCAACAAAIAKGEAPVSACVVGQKPVADQIASIMGVANDAMEKKVAFVKCVGDCDKTHDTYEYSGTKQCLMVKFAPSGGPKSCRFGCEGFGDCVAVCEYDAIHIVHGIAKVDEEKCMDCKKCMKACPKGLITEVPYHFVSHIGCSNPEKGKPVMNACGLGCISCQKCARNCPAQAIDMEKGYPTIDYSKCTNCGKCRSDCPRKCIV